jgi:hypothetical protein
MKEKHKDKERAHFVQMPAHRIKGKALIEFPASFLSFYKLFNFSFKKWFVGFLPPFCFINFLNEIE